MFAVILSYDKQVSFVKLLVASYEALWPKHPFVFLAPYNNRKPTFEVGAKRVSFVHTESSIRATMFRLLEQIDDDEFVYWAIDDRYPVYVPHMSVLDKLVEHIINERPDFDQIKITNHNKFYYTASTPLITIEGMPFYLQTKSPAVGFYMHHFTKARVLKELFLHERLPQIYSIRQFHELLLAQSPSNSCVLMPDASLIYFGETCRNGAMTKNCLQDLRKYKIDTPEEIEYLDEEFIYGSHGERYQSKKYCDRIFRRSFQSLYRFIRR